MEPVGSWALGLAATAIGGLAYSAGYEVRAYTLREFTAPVLAPGQADFRILHLSDLHMTPGQHRKQAWIKQLADLQPDLVVITGDFIAHRDAIAPVLESFADLAHIPGAFVFGSNDYYAPSFKNPARYLFSDDGKRIHGADLPTEKLRDGLKAFGWEDLTHRRTTMTINGVALELRGVDDAHLQRDDYSTIAGPVPAGMLGIGVTHAPYLRILDAMSADGDGLILAGHTHGGQLALPFVGALVTNCDIDTARAKGLHRHNESWLHVSAGLGTNPYTPVRFACRPEATLLTLTAGA